VAVLKEIAGVNPKLVKVISENRAKFLSMMQGADEPPAAPQSGIGAIPGGGSHRRHDPLSSS
jgi:hypothetical protein